MNLSDLVLDLALMLTTSYLVFIGWWPQAVFVFMFFLLTQAAKVIVTLHNPLPRIAFMAKMEQEKEEECPPKPE